MDSLFARFGKEFRAGHVLFREGASGEVMFVIQTGSVRITKTVGREERPLATLGRGEFIGEMAILNSKPRTATATAIEDTKCLVIDAKTLETMIATNSEIALRLVKKLARRLDAADELIQILMNPDPEARVMLGLKRRAEAYGEETPTGIKVQVVPSDLAQEVGSEERHVLEVLARLKRLRITTETKPGKDSKDKEARTIVVADVGRLLEFLEFLETPKKFGAT
jgi:CRP/FNR family cyclic AMP-dependent transcriptional regulator